MKNYNSAGDIAANMDALMRDTEFMQRFSSSSMFKKASDENIDANLEVSIEEPLEVKADDERADCVCCGKKRANWNESMGVCKCGSTNGCSPVDGCKPGCECGCVAKTASVNSQSMVKQAFNSLLAASDMLENIGLGNLSAQALVLANDLLVVEAAKKTDKEKALAAKQKEMKEKERLKAQKLKLREQKDKNDAKERALKEKSKLEKEKAKSKDADKVKKKPS